MARPRKDDAEWFSHDKHLRQDSKVAYLRSKFGSDGYAAWCMLLEVLTDSPGFKLSYREELERDIIARDFGIPLDRMNEIISVMVNIGLLQNDDGIIYSQNLIDRFKPLLDRRDYDKKRKQSGSFPHGKRDFPLGKPTENSIIHKENEVFRKESERKTHSIVEDSIGENRKGYMKVARNAPPQSVDDRFNNFAEEVKSFSGKYDSDMLQAFLDYWTEKTPCGQKMRFELQKTFEVSKRLATWKRNENKLSPRKSLPATQSNNGFTTVRFG